MRVSGGELRSRVIRSPRGAAVRPTPGRVKEALFSILGDRVDGARVLDLYAGTGAIGFEALSRGAAAAVFVESSAPVARAIRESAADLGLADRASVLCATVERAARTVAGRFDVVYADPPYALPAPAAAFAELRERRAVDAGTTIVYEHRESAPPLDAPGFATLRDARYGEVRLQFVRVEG